jgi:hypothetical protein
VHFPVSPLLHESAYYYFLQACTNGFDSVVAMLLAQGADCQMRSVTGLTAAQLAVQSGYFGIRDLLESHGKKLVMI